MLDLVFKNYITRSQSGRSNRRMTASYKAPNEKFFRKIFDTGIRELKIKDKNVEVSLNLVGEAKIKELNKKYRSKDKVTDVLSFPLEEAGLQKYDILPLGDIFICLPFAVKAVEERRRRNAKDSSRGKRQSIGLEKELAWLTVHGFLHLLGYDHEKSANDKKKMFALENKILNKLKK